MRLADLYEKQNEPREVLRVLSHAEALEAPATERAAIFKRIAVLQLEVEKRPDLAIQALERVLRDNPDDEEAAVHLARALDGANRYAELAMLHARRAERVTGNSKV